MDVDDPASLSRLYVSSHAFFAYVDGAFIILDRKSDRYLFIGEGDASAILRELGKDGPTAGSEAIHPAVSALEREGLVTRDANSGKKLTFLEGFPGSLELPGPKVDAIPNVRIGHVLDLAFACAKSAFLLKVRGFDTAVRSVEALRKRQPPSDRQSLDSISNLVEIYHRVKPYFFSAKDRCVMNSLESVWKFTDECSGVTCCRPWRRGSWPARRRRASRNRARGGAIGSSNQRCARRPSAAVRP